MSGLGRRTVLLVALLLAAVTACSSSSSGGSHSSTLTFNKTTARYHQLANAADLTSCPSSSATPTTASGGLPNLTFECLGSGPSVHLAGLSGKPAVINVWGSWCVPCQSETTYLSRAFDSDRSKVTFLGVDTEDEWDSALNFGTAVTPPVRYPSVYDEDRKALLALHVISPPLTVFVSKSGHIVHTVNGPFTSLGELQSDITTYLHVAT